MILYHFTLERYVESIIKHGILSIAEKQRRGMYPQAWMPPPEAWPGENETVWLTCDPNANAGIQGQGTPYRVMVEAEDAQMWFSYMAAKHVPGWVRKSYRQAALQLSPTNRDSDWYVLDVCIPPKAVLAITEVQA